MKYDFHELCTLFPPASTEDFTALVADIQANGLLEYITLYDGKILDGRNRYQACLKAKVEPEFDIFNGDDEGALAFVISKNLARRHLNESQRSMVAARLANMRIGDFAGNQHVPSANLQTPKVSQTDAAQKVNVSTRSVASARKVIDAGDKELIAAVDEGKVAVSVAAKIAELPKAERKKVLADERPDQAVKKAARLETEKALAKKQTALPDKKFGVVYADPEWKFETYSENGMDRSAENHYPTSSTSEIMERDVKKIAATDCVLFLWATAPMLPDALRVMAAWGFDYKSQFVWVKNKIGTGYWNRNKHEILLVGTKGKPPAPAMGTQFPSVIEASVGRHSEKPVQAYEIIEAYFPNLPKIELNARKRRSGWDAWGNEAGEEK